MTDLADRAVEIEQQMRDDALGAQARRAGLSGKTPRDSARRCQACAAPLPLARRQALPGVQTCVDCAREQEKSL